MYDELKEHCNLNELNTIINPQHLEKRRFHGSLTEGIYSNIEYAVKNYKFSLFIILSSRSLFYNKVGFLNLSEHKINCEPLQDIDQGSWWWPQFMKTKLATYVVHHQRIFAHSAHEGVVIDYYTCNKVIHFLESHKDIREDLFTYPACVEEFAIQTIACNLNSCMYDIGNGVYENKRQKDKFVCKVKRI